MNKTKANLIANRIIANVSKLYNNREYLCGAWLHNGKWIVSDGHRAIRFANDYELAEYKFKNKEDEKEYRKIYEECKEKIRSYFNVDYNKPMFELRLPPLDEVKEEIKEQKAAKVVLPTCYLKGIKDRDIVCKVNAAYLKDMIELYGKNIRAYWDGKIMHGVYFTDDENNDGILMTMRMER